MLAQTLAKVQLLLEEAQLNNRKILIYFHEEPLNIIKLDASSRKAGQDSGNTI